MAKHLMIAAAGLLVGCAGTQQSTETAQNPTEYCRSLGLEVGTEGSTNCVSNYIHQYCMSQGLAPGSPGYAQCEVNLREAAFLRRQLQMRNF